MSCFLSLVLFYSFLAFANAGNRIFPLISSESFPEYSDLSSCKLGFVGTFFGVSCSNSSTFYYSKGKGLDSSAKYVFTKNASLENETNHYVIKDDSTIGWGLGAIIVSDFYNIQWWTTEGTKLLNSFNVDAAQRTESTWVIRSDLAIIKTKNQNIYMLQKNGGLSMSGLLGEIQDTDISIPVSSIQNIFLFDSSEADKDSSSLLIGVQKNHDALYVIEFFIGRNTFSFEEMIDLSWANCQNLTTHCLEDFFMMICDQGSSTNVTTMYFYSKQTFELVAQNSPSPILTATSSVDSSTNLTVYSKASEYLVSFAHEDISLGNLFDKGDLIYLVETSSYIELLYLLYSSESHLFNQVVSTFKFQFQSGTLVEWMEYGSNLKSIYMALGANLTILSSCKPYFSYFSYTDDFSNSELSGCIKYSESNKLALNDYENTAINIDCFNGFSFLCLADKNIKSYFNWLLAGNNSLQDFDTFLEEIEDQNEDLERSSSWSPTSLILSLTIGFPVLCIISISIIAIVMIRRSRWWQLYQERQQTARKEREMKSILDGFSLGIKIQDLPEGEEENLNRIRAEIKECIKNNELGIYRSDEEDLNSAVRSQYREFDSEKNMEASIFRFNLSKITSPNRKNSQNSKLNPRCPICTKKIGEKKFSMFKCGKHRAHTNCLWLYSSYKRKKREEDALDLCPFRCTVNSSSNGSTPPKGVIQLIGASDNIPYTVSSQNASEKASEEEKKEEDSYEDKAI